MARLLGIDASGAVVRTAILRTSYRRVVVEALGEVSFAEAGSEASAIRLAAGMQRPDACALAISGERAFYRRLDLPAAAQKELDSVLAFELEAAVPFDMTEGVFDYRLLKRASGTAEIPIFATVARADDVRERIAAARGALGTEPERVSAGALALADLAAVIPELERPVAPPTGDGGPPPAPGTVPIALLDLGEASSDLVVLLGGEAVFARTLSRGTAGLPASAYALAREVRQTIAAWRAASGGPLAAIYLSGGGAQAAGAEVFLASELRTRVAPLPPPRLEGLTPEQLVVVPRFAKAIALALGLAGRSRAPNLRQGALEAQRSYPFLREKIPLFTGLGAVIVASFGFSIVAEMQSLNAEHAALTDSLRATSQAVLGEATEDPGRARELLEQGPGDEDDPLPRADAFDVMVQLSKAVPKETVHDVVELDVARGHVSIQGTVPGIPDVQPVAEKMKEHKCFRDVKVPRTSQFGQDKQRYVLEFDIKCDEAKKKKGKGAEPAASSEPEEGAR
jgi:general secretion pathway protein L